MSDLDGNLYRDNPAAAFEKFERAKADHQRTELSREAKKQAALKHKKFNDVDIYFYNDGFGYHYRPSTSKNRN